MKIKVKEVHFAWLSLILGIFIIYCIFIKADLVEILDQKITFIIASFGILFSGIQIWMGSIRSKNEFTNNMRYEEYKRTRELIKLFFNYLSENMGEENNIHLLDRQLVNVKNELVVIIQTSNKSIFKGIKDIEEVKKFGIISDEIINRTDNLRLVTSGVATELEIEVEKMNWHNEVRDKVKALHELKYPLFEFMEKRIIG